MAEENKAVVPFSGNKYKREFQTTDDGFLDIYCVLDAFSVTCACIAHAIKKLLCAGMRGKGDKLQDLREARDAITRAIQMEENRQAKILRSEKRKARIQKKAVLAKAK